MKFESNQGPNTLSSNSEEESLPANCNGCHRSKCWIDDIPKTCAEMAAELNGETLNRKISVREDDFVHPSEECDLEDIDEMILEIERTQARERGQGPCETLPEMEYIIANEWGD